MREGFGQASKEAIHFVLVLHLGVHRVAIRGSEAAVVLEFVAEDRFALFGQAVRRQVFKKMVFSGSSFRYFGPRAVGGGRAAHREGKGGNDGNRRRINPAVAVGFDRILK